MPDTQLVSKSSVPPVVARVTDELSELLRRSDGTLASLILRKKGVGIGPMGAQIVYNDDLVHVLLWTGFHYPELAEHSLKCLDTLWNTGTLARDLMAEAAAEGVQVDAGITVSGIHDIWNALRRASGGQDAASVANDFTTLVEQESAMLSEMPSRNMEPYSTDGRVVTGVKVYTGPGTPADPRSTKPGTLYISGVKLGEVVLNEAPNGQWTPDRKPKTVVKQLLRAKLPIGRFVRYALDPDNLVSFKVGKDASASAKRGGVVIDPEAVRSLFKIAG